MGPLLSKPSAPKFRNSQFGPNSSNWKFLAHTLKTQLAQFILIDNICIWCLLFFYYSFTLSLFFVNSFCNNCIWCFLFLWIFVLHFYFSRLSLRCISGKNLSPAQKNLLIIAFIFYILNKISPNGIFLKEILTFNWLNSLFASCSLINLTFLQLQKFYTSSNSSFRLRSVTPENVAMRI